MTWNQFIQGFDEYWATITFIVATVFVIYYSYVAPWYKTPMGRALVAVDLGLAVATFPTAMLFLFNWPVYNNHIAEVIVMLVAVGVPIAILSRIYTLFTFRKNHK